jgi:catechol 2,3-dioxygenase-like lactoylglutathione lyase family enzyme
MSRSVTRTALCALAVCLLLCSGVWFPDGTGLAGTPQSAVQAEPDSPVLELSEFMLYVGNLDRSIAFYRDVIGLELPPRAGPPPWTADPDVLRVHNTIGGAYRVATLKLPGAPPSSGLELVEYRGINRKPVRPRIQDVGAATIILTVRDLDAIWARVKASGASVATTGGGPVTVSLDGVNTRAVMVKDPDGSLVELRETAGTDQPGGPSGNVIDTRFGITVTDADKAARFYRDVFGFAIERTTPFTENKQLLDLVGTPGARLRRSLLRVPGGSFIVEFIELEGIKRSNVRPADALRRGVYVLPGVGALKLNVRDMRSLVGKLESDGSTIVSAGGHMIEHVHNRDTHVVVRDPNDLFVQLSQRNAPQ